MYRCTLVLVITVALVIGCESDENGDTGADASTDTTAIPTPSGALAWVGIPDPASSFGFDPLTIERPASPLEWPDAEAPSAYYIDISDAGCTDSNNPRGYPSMPRCSMPDETLVAGSLVEVHGSGYRFSAGNQWQPLIEGTSAEPVWLVGVPGEEPLMNGKWTVRNSSYFIVEHIVWDTNGTAIDLRENNHHVVIRNVEAYGDNTESSGGAAMGAGSSDPDGRNQYIVYHQLNIHDIGTRDPTIEDDVMGVTAGLNCDYVWVLDSDIVRVGGDSVRPGTNLGNLGGDESLKATHIYIAGNRFSDNGENAIDVKFSENVVISGNDMHTFAPSDSSSGSCVVAHEKASHVYIIGNRVHNCEIGLITTDDVQNVWYIGNVIYNIHEPGTFDQTSHFGGGVAMHVRGGSSGGALFNSMYDYDKGFQGAGVSPGFVVWGNIFAGRSEPMGYDIMYQDTGLARDSVQDFNLYQDFRALVGTDEITSLSDLTSAYSHDASGVTGDPGYAEPENGNLHIGVGSPAAGAGPSMQHDVFASYEALFGVSAALDLDGDERPLGSGLDIGADEVE